MAYTASRDVIIRTEAWDEALNFYGRVLGFPVFYETETMVGFETGGFRLYVEKGSEHGPVFDFLTEDVPAAKAALMAAECELVEEDESVPRLYLRDRFGMTFNVGRRVAD
jgi:hypothetical protein